MRSIRIFCALTVKNKETGYLPEGWPVPLYFRGWQKLHNKKAGVTASANFFSPRSTYFRVPSLHPLSSRFRFYHDQRFQDQPIS